MTFPLFLLLASIISDIAICIAVPRDIKRIKMYEKIAYLNVSVGIIAIILFLIEKEIL